MRIESMGVGTGRQYNQEFQEAQVHFWDVLGYARD